MIHVVTRWGLPQRYFTTEAKAMKWAKANLEATSEGWDADGKSVFYAEFNIIHWDTTGTYYNSECSTYEAVVDECGKFIRMEEDNTRSHPMG